MYVYVSCFAGATATKENTVNKNLHRPKKRRREHSKPKPKIKPEVKVQNDVEAAIFLAANKLKTSPDVQEHLGLSVSQCNKRIKLIKKGAPTRKVSVTVRCERRDCSCLLYRFDCLELPWFDKKCDCYDMSMC